MQPWLHFKKIFSSIYFKFITSQKRFNFEHLIVGRYENYGYDSSIILEY